jgi:predicted ATPase
VGYGARAGELAAELAVHFEQGRDYCRAVHYLQQAAAHAIRQNASQEVIALATKGVALLGLLPETPARLHQALGLQVVLGQALMATKGFTASDVERVYVRARELCEQIGDNQKLFQVLRGLIVYYANRGDVQTTCQLGEQLLSLAQAEDDPTLLMLAHYMMGMAMHARGEPAAAYTHLMQVLALYTPQAHRDLTARYGIDPGVGAHCFLARVLWFLGYPDQALQYSQEPLRWTQEASSLYNLTVVLYYTAVLHQFRREAQAVHEQSVAAMTLSTEQGFALWLAMSTVLEGWALAMQGQVEAGIAQMHQGLAATEAMGFKAQEPYSLGLLAEAYGAEGCPEEGLNALAKVASVMEATESRWYKAELFRLKGTLLLTQAVPDASQAEACFHQALDIARQQQAKSWELRAATSLARLWQQQGKQDDARTLLTDVYGWFTEGFDTADLQEARALLEALA